jgi:tetratricopeptide (TPR) repeat protein
MIPRPLRHPVTKWLAPLMTAACLPAVARAAREGAAPGVETVTALSNTFILIAGVLVVIILLPIAFLVYRRAFATVRSEEPEIPKNPLQDAEREERRGNHLAAATSYAAAGNMMKAAECYEKGKDLVRAAECYENAGHLDRAAELHVRSGGSLRAAGIFMKTKNYIEAAKIFRNKGDHLRAAQALELFGNRVAAARSYTAAGQHARAARLLEEEKMYAEAAEAYRPVLGGDEATRANLDHFSTWAALLAHAGKREEAIAAYRKVLAVNPDHQRAYAGLLALVPRQAPAAPARPSGTAAAPAAQAAPTPTPAAPATPASAPVELSPDAVEDLAREIDADFETEDADPLKRVFTLRSMIHAGRMEPRYSMRLWVQVMRSLAEKHHANTVFGFLTPDAIFIDMQNNVRIEKPKERRAEYIAPEIQAGLPPDRQADIYSMGVILFELVTGTLEFVGKKRPAEVNSDIPPWMDHLILHCMEKNLTKRYRTTDEVSAVLLQLKSAAQD